MRKPVFVVSMFALTLAVAPACATKKFVRTEVGQVNDKVATLGKSLEETQERVRQNEGRITEVDRKAGGRRRRRRRQAQQAAQSAASRRGHRRRHAASAPTPSKRRAASSSSKSC